MADLEPDGGAPRFRELHGEYVENAGQRINLREYLDYFEPLGSALSRLPDGTGGPFVYQFTDSGGRTIASVGWVVSAASKRFGAWKLWGMWTDRPIPAVVLPLFWSELPDAGAVSALVARANERADRLFDRRRWTSLLDDINTTRLHDDAFRETLKSELARAWAVPPPHRHSIEVELPPRLLDLLPWLYVLGPVDPAAAQLQPSRFNGAGYQYIFATDRTPSADAISVPAEIVDIVDTAASDVLSGWRKANDLRARRGRPKRVERVPPRSAETTDMRSESPAPPARPKTPAKPRRTITLGDVTVTARAVATPLYRIAVLALLAWTAWNVHLIRKNTSAPQRAAVAQEEPSTARIRRIAALLAANPPRGIRIPETVLDDVTTAEEKIARLAIEIHLRRSGCHPRTEAVDARLSAAEQRAIRNCTAIQEAALVAADAQPDLPRALAWLERTLASPE